MPRISPESLESFAASLLESVGSPPAVAGQVAESLVLADLAGHHSHGTHRIPSYAERVRNGRFDPDATPETVAETAVTATIDGNHQFGQVVGRRAVEAGVGKAGEAGVAAVGIRNATHLGRIGEWAERTAREGYLFASFVNVQGGTPLVAPAGSTEPKLGTNPLTFGVPSFGALEFPVVLDMATSQVAHGKTAERATTGEPLPAGWVVDEEGGDLTDPAAFDQGGEGALRPAGGEVSGYKGYGLAVIAELFAGIAGDGRVFGQDGEARGNGALFLTADPLAFTSEAEVIDRVAALSAYLKDAERDVEAGPAARGEDEIMLPGEGEHRSVEDGRENGIPMDAAILGTLADLARERGIEDAIPPEAR